MLVPDVHIGWIKNKKNANNYALLMKLSILYDFNIFSPQLEKNQVI